MQRNDSSPSISVLTSTLGQEGLGYTAESLAGQTKLPDEWIVKDAITTSEAKTDWRQVIPESIDIKYIPKRDAGLSDGLNQGLDMTSGDIVALLHNADGYAPEFLARMSSDLPERTVRYCDVIWTKNEKPFMTRQSKDSISMPIYDMPRVNHPTFVCHRTVYEEVGYFSTDYKIAMDLDWLLRALALGIRFERVPFPLYMMDSMGLSHSNFSTMKAEVSAICSEHGSFDSKILFELHWLQRRSKLLLKSLLARG